MGQALRRYYRGATLAAMEEVQTGRRLNYHFDHQGTVQCLTDDTGAVTDRFASDAWGVPVKRTGTSINRQWYVGNLGYYRQVDQALDYVRARYYAAARSSWLAPDLPGFLSNVTSRQYCLNQPTRLEDISGWYCNHDEDPCTEYRKDITIIEERREPGRKSEQNGDLPNFSKLVYFERRPPGSGSGAHSDCNQKLVTLGRCRVACQQNWHVTSVTRQRRGRFGWVLTSEACQLDFFNSCPKPFNAAPILGTIIGALGALGTPAVGLTAGLVGGVIGSLDFTKRDDCKQQTTSLTQGQAEDNISKKITPPSMTWMKSVRRIVFVDRICCKHTHDESCPLCCVRCPEDRGGAKMRECDHLPPGCHQVNRSNCQSQ